MANELPLVGEPLAQGLSYRKDQPPDTDASPGVDAISTDILGNVTNVPAPMQGVSLATEQRDAPQNIPFFWNSGYPVVPGAPGSYRTDSDK